LNSDLGKWLFISFISVNAHANNGRFFNDTVSIYEVGMRTRYQFVNDNLEGDASAFTTRLNFTANFLLADSWHLSIQPNYVHSFNKGRYNSVRVKQNTSPIPDPEGLNLSKVFLNYDSHNDWQIRLGRQKLSFDNERMIGAIEFWQTPQNFDAVKFDYNDQLNWHLQYVYTNKVHRIFGQNSTLAIPKNDVRYGIFNQRPANELGQHQLSSHLINAAYKTENNLSLVSYAYLVENTELALFSTNTFGFRLSDEFKPAKIKYRYSAEFALQKNTGNNLQDYQAWYNLLEASVQYKSHIMKLSQEVFSEDNKQGFITPLGTNHKFQGWADVFTGYGVQSGLRDQYFTYRGRYKKFRWRAVYHHFNNYQNSSNIGNELDLELAYRATRKWEFKVIYAGYRTKDGLLDFPKVNNDLSTWFVSMAYNI